MSEIADTIDLSATFVVRLIDDLTGLPPSPVPACSLAIERDGEFVPTGARPMLTPSRFLTFRDLGFPRHGTERYRILVDPGDLRPFLWTVTNEVVLDPMPASGEPPPPQVIEIELLPAPNYAFPSHVRVVRGRVLRDDEPAVDVLVQASVPDAARQDRSLTDERGAFGLAVRWFEPDEPLVVVASAQDGVEVEVTLDSTTAFSTPITIDLSP
jgi:hypothetical protein